MCMERILVIETPKIFKDPQFIEDIKKHIKDKKNLKKEIEENRAYLNKILTTDDVIAAIKHFTPLKASEERKQEIKRMIIDCYTTNLRKKEAADKKNNEKMNRQILKRASKSISYNNGIDKDLYNKISLLESMKAQLTYIDAADETQKWINYTIWCNIDPEAIIINNIDEETKCLVNGICKMLHLKQIYQFSGIADLQLYDPFIAGWNGQRFLLNLEALKKLDTISLQQKVQLKNAKMIIASPTVNDFQKKEKPDEKPSLSSPIRLFTKTVQPTATINNIVTDPVISTMLANAVIPYINGREYWFESVNSTTYRLKIKNIITLVPEEYTLVVGYHGKDIVSLVATTIYENKVVIHPAFTDLWANVLGNCFYRLSDYEINVASQYQSPFFWLYELVDLSNIDEAEFRSGLDSKLHSIFTALNQKGVVIAGRKYRFEDYTSINKFTLEAEDASVIFVENNDACYKINNTFINVSI